MPRVAVNAPKKRTAPKTVKLAEEFSKGTVLTDILKKQWKLGDVIGQGGFGLVYLANSADSSATSPNGAQYVIKIEPGANGPLFCEMNFYIRAAKKEFIQEFITSHKLKYLAVPPYIGSGLHDYNKKSYRFLVMPRYQTDLHKLLQTAGGTFPSTTVFAIGMRMMDALQYLHEREYVHADIKASNILLDFDGRSENKNQVYLADYGLAYRYTANNEHKGYKVDPRSAHNGTIEFTSRDAHKGVFPSRRGDLEILGFCLLQWLCGKLPWETHLTNPKVVAQMKEESMADTHSLIKACFPGRPTSSSDCILKYLKEVDKLDYEEEPNYRKFKDMLKAGLTNAGQKDEWKIGFTTESKATKRRSQGAESPRVSPKKPKMVAQKADNASPLKKRGRPPSKSPAVNGKTPAIVPPPSKPTPSPAVSKRSPAKAKVSKKRFDDSKPRRAYQIPPPSKTPPKKSQGAPKQIRRVRNTRVSKNDAAIQTTPGLKNNQ